LLQNGQPLQAKGESLACYDHPVPDQFTREDVERLARLARLALSDDEKALFARQLGEILGYAEQVRQVDTSGIPPTSHAFAYTASLRDDQIRPSLGRDEALSQAPDAIADTGLFKVPRVLG
jgi:aspartyl-tRNA(Asn)/glutamyl-tRNA(Gln) amidotransferase subunit C